MIFILLFISVCKCLHLKLTDYYLTFLILFIGLQGICTRYDNIGGGHQSAYHLGDKRCSECGLYIRFDGTGFKAEAKEIKVL